jgi:hypothetical protein
MQGTAAGHMETEGGIADGTDDRKKRSAELFL